MNENDQVNKEAKDLSGREDIVAFLWTFYRNAFQDPLIGRFFTEVVPLDLDTHIPQIADFWEAIVFNTQGYRKNVMEVHRHIHHLSEIKKEHLDRWVSIFSSTLDKSFSGSRTELMKQRARSIATMMDIKLNHPGITG